MSGAAARIFAEATRLIGDAMLLVTPAGMILAANRAAIAELGLDPRALPGCQLADLVARQEDGRLQEMLRFLSGSREPQPVTLALRTEAEGPGVRHYRCDGALFQPEPDSPRLLQLRLRPKEEAIRSFALLTRQIDHLNREIIARRRFETDLREALEAQSQLLRELQHRVGNTLQVILSLLNRELRQAGEAVPALRLRTLVARVQAIGFVQKQIVKATDIWQVEVARLVRDIADYLYPSTGSRNTAIDVDVEPTLLPIEVATPLALVLTDCLSRIGPARMLIEGQRRASPAQLALSITWSAQSEAFAMPAADPFLAATLGQMRGALLATAEKGTDTHRLTLEIPIPAMGRLR